jgi:hypothetical protein
LNEKEETIAQPKDKWKKMQPIIAFIEILELGCYKQKN